MDTIQNNDQQSSRPEHVYPIFDKMLSRSAKEQLLGQKGLMVWFTGLSGSGKSTLAVALERELHQRGLLCRILDGDNIRTGIITLAAFISPDEKMRQMAASIIGNEDFLEVYVNTPIEACEKRDVKGLYAKARKGEIKNFTGVSAPFEAPENPDISIDTSVTSLEESVQALLSIILPKIKI